METSERSHQSATGALRARSREYQFRDGHLIVEDAQAPTLAQAVGA
jgi:hypothetical protein